MALPVLAWYDDADVGVITSLTFSGVIPGTSSAAQEVHLWNQKGGTDAETVRNLRILAYARLAGETLFLAAGTRWLDERWLEARVVGGTGDVVVALTAWQPVGAGASLPLADLPKNSAHYVEWRLSPPQVSDDEFPASPPSIEWLFVPVDAPAFAIGLGHSEASPDGVLIGVGDGAYSGVLIGSNVTESATPAGTVEVGYSGWVSNGVPQAEAAQQLTLSNLDSSSAALTSGQAYWALVAWTPVGTVVTKGVNAASGSAVRPDIPAGHQPRAWVLREFDGVINDADIENVWVAARYRLATTSGLIATFGPGESRVDNSLTRHTYPFNVSLAASEINTVWMTRGGAPDVTVAGDDPPEPRALRLYELTTDGSGVTSYRDLRMLIGARSARKMLPLNAVLATDNVSPPDAVEGCGDLLLDPEFPAALALYDFGTSPTAGESRIDLQYSAAGATYASIYPDDASMLKVAYNATEPVTRVSQPTACVIPAGSRVRARVDAPPTATTAPSGATVILQGWER